MQYNVPSLQHIAIIKIVATVWSHNDIRDLLAKLDKAVLSPCFIYGHIEWLKLENIVTEKVTQIPQLGIYEEKIVCFIKPIGVQILKWMKYHCSGNYLCLDVPSKFCWTPHGTINRKETAKMLIKDDNVGMTMRYKLAYIYCFEDDIKTLWQKIPKNLRKSFPNKLCPVARNQWSRVSPQSYARNILQEGWDKTIFDNQTAFITHALVGNKIATEYFYKKLTLREREMCMVATAKNVKDADVRIFLLSQMNEEQQKEIFRSEHYFVLESFLDWPLQNFFIETANRMWDFLPKWEYFLILKLIIDKRTLGFKDWNYQETFANFWQESPDDFKHYITNELDSVFLLESLFKTKDKANLKLILQSATFIEKKNLIYCYNMREILKDLIIDAEWDLLGYFIQECLPSREELIKFKEEFEKHVIIDSVTINRDKWDQLFHLSDDANETTDCKFNKRECSEAESNSSKKFCSLK